jgi:hypothetical protein
MLWLNPLTLFALAAIAAPILIHILVRRTAERFPFPTLRFLQPTRLAAIRRHLLEDGRLLAVRAALLAAAAAALAGPLLVTAARRQGWDRRVVRAVVREGAAAEIAPPGTFEGSSLADGIRRAIVWLDTAPPARREIVIASAFPIGSITGIDIAAIPADVGVRFERTGTLPRTRTVPAGRLLTNDGIRAREVTLAGEQTSSSEARATGTGALPIEIESSPDEQSAIDAAVNAVLTERVWAAPPDRRARVVVVQAVGADLKVRTTPAPRERTAPAPPERTAPAPPEVAATPVSPEVVQAFPPPLAPDTGELRRGSPKPIGEGGRPALPEAVSGAFPITQPWMADAVAGIARDRDLAAAGARVASGLTGAAFASAPWQTLAFAADGRPLAVAATSANRLLVASAAPASDLATPVLLRSIANAIASVPDLRADEVVAIADPVLRQWSRPPAPMTAPRINTVDRDDRRWLWGAVLGLLALETWLRRSRTADAVREHREEDARVA